MTLYADRALAARLEGIAAADLRAFAEASAGLFEDMSAAWLQVGDGIAGFCGRDSAVNGTVGLGVSVPVTEADVIEIERFFHDRDARPMITVCPLADATLAQTLMVRGGWSLAHFENVLVRACSAALDVPPPDPAIEIVIADSAEQRLAWADLLIEGFSAPETPTSADLRLGHTVASMPDRTFLMALVDGEPAGTGELVIANGVGWLSADTTLQRFRGRGVQQSLQRARLGMARDAGCELAVSESMPGSGSQRNMERLGFRVVYTRTEMAGPPPQRPL